MFVSDIKTQIWARETLPIFVQRAQERRIIRFKELTNELGLPWRGNIRQMGHVCRHIVKTLAALETEDDWEGEILLITSIVLKANGEFPTNMCKVLTRDYYKQPSPERLQIELNCSFDHEEWDAVLATLSLPNARKG